MKKIVLWAAMLLLLVAVRFFATAGSAPSDRAGEPPSGPRLRSAIGCASLPADSQSVYPERHSTLGDCFRSPGVGDTIPDFTLFTAEGTAVRASDELARGTPLVMIAGSYSCPLFRDRLDSLNALVQRHGPAITVLVVYTVEAHPEADSCPYTDMRWPAGLVENDPVHCRQPATYGERREIVRTMLDTLSIVPRVVIDGPSNPWWWTFGPAPNNAYLIDTNGVVVLKQMFYAVPPDDLPKAVDRLLSRHQKPVSYQ
jgi:hypothetical protein